MVWYWVLAGLGLGVLLGIVLRRRQHPIETTVRRKIVVIRPGGDHDAVSEMIAGMDGHIVDQLPMINGFTYEQPADGDGFVALAQHEDIVRIDDDLEVRILEQPSPSRSWWWRWNLGRRTPAPQTTPWGVSRINAPQVWPVVEGTGVRVAVLDTGIYSHHPDLAANVAGGVNYVSPGQPPEDDHGHGTHVAGTIAALSNSQGVVGVAPRASLYAVKILDQRGSGYLSNIVKGLDWCINNHMQVANLSFGTEEGNETFAEAVRSATQAGVTLVVSAGNSGPAANTVTYPAKYPETIAVAASAANDQIASFSSRGPEVDVAAPGVSINSTWLSGSYNTLSGTSMASPHVTGTAALVLNASPVLRPDQVRTALATSAKPLAGADKESQGAGLVDALGAVNAVRNRQV